MVFDGAACPHFEDCRKRTLGESLCMSKDEANQRSDDETRRLTSVAHVRSFKCSHEVSCLSLRPWSSSATAMLENKTRRKYEDHNVHSGAVSDGHGSVRPK